MGGGVEAPDTSLVRRGQWGERRRGKGGVETPDTSLVRRNQKRGGRKEKKEEVWRPLTRLWSEETKRNRRKEGADRRKRGRGEGRLSSLTRL